MEFFENVYYFKHLSCHFLLSQPLFIISFSLFIQSQISCYVHKNHHNNICHYTGHFSPSSIYSINIYISTKWPFDVFSFLFCSSAHFQSSSMIFFHYLFIFNLIFITHTSHIKRWCWNIYVALEPPINKLITRHQ